MGVWLNTCNSFLYSKTTFELRANYLRNVMGWGEGTKSPVCRESFCCLWKGNSRLRRENESGSVKDVLGGSPHPVASCIFLRSSQSGRPALGVFMSSVSLCHPVEPDTGENFLRAEEAEGTH